MTAADRTIRPRDLAEVASRATHVQALLTPERMQGPGFAFAMLPVLRRLYPPGSERAEAVARHGSYFATHPVLIGYVLGIAARLEERRAAGQASDSRAIDQSKRALGSALAAVGDPLFWVTARPLAGLVGVLSIFLLPPPSPGTADARVLLGPLALLLTYNAIALPFRLVGPVRGYGGAEDPASVVRSLGGQEVRGALERAGAVAFGAWLAFALIDLKPLSDTWGHGLAQRALAAAPFLLGALVGWIGHARKPGAAVETAAAALLGGLALAAFA